MQRFALAGLVFALFLVAPLSAAEIQGSFVKYDDANKVLTVEVKGAKSDYTLNDDTKVMTVKGEPAKQGIKCFSKAKPGAVLTLITIIRDGKDIVTEVKLGGRRN